MIVVDTNVLSELTRPAPEARVVAWVRENAASLALPSVAIGELSYGVARLPDGRRKESLTRALETLTMRYAGRILSFDAPAAKAYGTIMVEATRVGRPMSLPDAQIAAITRVARASLATRNTSDFASTGLKLINPWLA